jgi:plasmid stability protein
MASITIRQLDDDLKRRLRLRAARNGRSMEDEARTILRDAASLDDDKDEARAPARQPAAPRGRVAADAPARAAQSAFSSSSAAASPPIRRSISSAG